MILSARSDHDHASHRANFRIATYAPAALPDAIAGVGLSRQTGDLQVGRAIPSYCGRPVPARRWEESSRVPPQFERTLLRRAIRRATRFRAGSRDAEIGRA